MELKTMEECMDILNCHSSCSDQSVEACNQCLEIELSDEFKNCPSCESPDYVLEGEFYVCLECGFSLASDEEPWNYYHEDDEVL